MKNSKYVVDVVCVNCGYIEFKRKVDIGTPITNATCKKCLCTTLSLFPAPIFISDEDKMIYVKKMQEYAAVLHKTSKDKEKFLQDAGIYNKKGEVNTSFNFNGKPIGFEK